MAYPVEVSWPLSSATLVLAQWDRDQMAMVAELEAVWGHPLPETYLTSDATECLTCQGKRW